jgi:hypothetical protein
VRVTETLMAPGSWSLSLRRDAVGSRAWLAMRAALAGYDPVGNRWVPAGDGYVAVFPTQRTSTPASFAGARYVGHLLSASGPTGFAGEGLPSLLNRSNGYGVIATSTTSYSSRSLSAWLDAVLPVNGLTKGAVSTAGLSNASGRWVAGQGARELLAEVCGAVGGAEWRVNPDGTVDAAATGALFRSGQVVVSPSPAATLGFPRGVDGSVLAYSIDCGTVASRTVVAGDGDGDGMTVAVADAATPVVYGLGGAAATVAALVDAPGADSAESAALASAQLAIRTSTRDSYRLAVRDLHVWEFVDAGDSVWVWAPDAGVDGGPAVAWQGQTIRPQLKRVHSMSGPVPAAWSVWLFRSSVGEWVDLTSWVEWESGDVFATVGQGVGPVAWARESGAAWLGVTSQLVPR